MIRAIIQSIIEGAIKRFTASGRPGEIITNREYMDHYGITSSPLPGAEGVVIQQGNQYIMIATDDRRYRIPLVNGEVALYTDEGDFIHFQRGRQITVNTGNKLFATCANEADVTAPVVNVTASTSCQIDSPLINLSGDRAGLRRFIDDRFQALFNDHVHSGCGGSVNSGPPTASLDLGSYATNIVRGA